MTKRLWIVAATLAVVVAIGTATAAYVAGNRKQRNSREHLQCLRRKRFLENGMALITTSTTAYRVTLETEGGNDVTVRPNRKKYFTVSCCG